MSSLSILAPIASSVASSLFDQLERTNVLSKLKYVIKKWLLPNVYCIVLDENSYTKINLDTAD